MYFGQGVDVRASKSAFVFVLMLGLAACSKGPEQVYPLASLGMISGALSENGRYAAVGSILHGGSYWDMDSRNRLYDWNHRKGEYSTIRAVSISGNSSRAVTVVDDSMVVWSTATGEYLQYWRASGRILAIELNGRGDRALIGLDNGRASYFDVEQGKEIFNFHHDAEVRAVAMTNDDELAITGSDDNTAKIWNLKTGKVRYTFKHRNQIKTVAISPEGKYAFTTAQREDAIIWDLATGKKYQALGNRYTNYTVARFTANEKHLLLGTFQGRVMRVGVASGKVENQWQAKLRKPYGEASSKAILAVSESANKNQIFALTSDGMWESFSL
jgi:WD40 repeat protein